MSTTNMYHSLIKMLFNRENYYKYIHFLRQETLPEELKTIVKDLDFYYGEHDTVDNVNADDFLVWFGNVRHRSYSSDLLECHKALLEKVVSSKTELAETVIQHFNTEALKKHIEEVFEEKKEAGVSDIVDLCQDYLKTATLSTKFDSFFHDMDAPDEEENYGGGQLSWRLSCLNESIGRIGPGDFGIVFAGTNAGKTSFLCSEVSYMCTQISDKPILWFYNEGSFHKLKHRFWSACLKMTSQQIRDYPEVAKEEYRTYCNGDINKVRFYNATNMSIYDVEHISNTYRPALVVIDQLDNLSGFDKSQRDDIRALKLFQRARSISINCACPMIVADQATNTEYFTKDGEKRCVRYLSKHQLQGSRIAKQSTAEFMIGIGYDSEEPETRYITTPKVKSLEGTNNNELERQAWFRREIARFED